ncbi:MAG TPA: hypothetical protein P5563_11125 [Saprospiraceae bacterium]|nr:hypothetical protein [Saprospiraceae bacterium]
MIHLRDAGETPARAENLACGKQGGPQPAGWQGGPMMLFVVRCSLFVPVLNSTILQFFSRHGGQGFPLLQLSPYPFYLLRSTFYVLLQDSRLQ